MLNSQFVQVALPLMVTLTIAAWVNSKGIDGLGKRIDDLRSEMNRRFEDVNRRFDDVNRQFTEVNRRFDKVDDLLNGHDQRIVRLEERTSPLTRR
jgi:uncharacterized protein YoxC